MKNRYLLRAALLPCTFLLVLTTAYAQVTWSDYERALGTRTRYRDLVVSDPGPANWIEKTDEFWYRRSVKGGNEFVLVDAKAKTRKPAFDHEKLAASLSTAAGEKYTAITLPFQTFHYVDDKGAIEFSAKGSSWKCDLKEYACRKTGPASDGAFGRGATRGPEEDSLESPAEYGNDVYDGMVDPSPQQGQGRGAGPGGGPAASEAERVKTSPDGKWQALIRNYNVFLRPKGQADSSALSLDGSEGNYYTFQSITWSPDSAHLVAYRVRPGYKREIHYVESSPTDQLQPKYSSREYAKPGDTLDIAAPVLFEIATKKQFDIDNALFPNPFSLTGPVWRKSSHAFTFEYNQRGHQVYRVIEVDAQTGKARAVITEESKTFIDYRPLLRNQRDTEKKVRYDVNDGQEVVWMSERDGWAHLYLYDGVTGAVKNQITKGNWVVRSVDKVDDEKRQIWFGASGMDAGKNPYYVQYYRINFDGSGLTRLTDGDGDHTVAFSADMKYYVDTWSRVDTAPVSQLRQTEDQKTVMELEHADHQRLSCSGLACAGAVLCFGARWQNGHLGCDLPAAQLRSFEEVSGG